jgi:hypothetical protein
MTYELKKINLVSALKISLLIHIVIGLVVGLLAGITMLFISSFAGMIPSRGGFNNMQNFPFAFGIFGSFFIMIAYLIMVPVMGVIATAIVVSLYNLFARLWGGLRIELNNIAHIATTPAVQAAVVGPSETPESGSSTLEGNSHA